MASDMVSNPKRRRMKHNPAGGAELVSCRTAGTRIPALGTRRSGQIVLVVLAFMLLAAGRAQAGGTEWLTGAGSSLAYPLYSAWAGGYHKHSGVAVNYQSIGSGGGIRQIEARTVDFGATDAPLSATRLGAQGLVQFPTALGSIVPAVNLPGIAAGELTLSGPLLAAIYRGRIKRWNAPAIARLNPGLALPARPIAVVYRADGSGTTFIFTRYLARVSAAWKRKVGFGKAVAWPRGIGGKGNEGVAAYVKHIPGAIGYVEYAYARATHMTMAAMINRAGKRVEANPKSFAAAAAQADWGGAANFDVMLTDEPGTASWPLLGATFALVPARPRDPAAARGVLAFFAWAWSRGAATAARLGYVPLPARAVRRIERLWHARIRAGGKALWPPAGAMAVPPAGSAS